MFRYLPEQASDFAPNADWIHNLITDISVFFTVAIVGAMIYFAIRYRQKDGVDHETPQIRGSHLLEIVWTVVPTIICIIVAYYGVVYYKQMRVVPKDALTINVTAQQWFWTFQYENGKTTKDEFVIPVDRPVKLVMQSKDVLHSLFIPAMRVKKDTIPGAYTYISFRPVKTGVYQSYCTEFCGDKHSAMLATLRVVSQSEYDQWVNDRSEELALLSKSPAEQGRALYIAKGCNGCHSIDGSAVVGPSFLKLWGRKEKLADGSEYEVDENYIRESILNPNAKLVAGYPAGVMPSYTGQLDEDHINQLIAFIKTLDGSQPVEAVAAAAPAAAAPDPALAAMSPVERGKKWYGEKLCITCHSLDGSRLVGPSFLGIYGRTVKFVDGTTAVSDDAYLRDSILNPMAHVVEGYPPAMPGGLLNEEQTADMIEYLKTVK